MDPDRWRRAADVFEAALDRPEADKRAYVDEACAGDVDLRREVEALIDEDRRSSPLDVAISSEALATLSFVKNIGPYHLDTLLGAGGMGEVYRARDPRLGRDVAIKILPAAFAGDRARLARFKREAQVLASLNHPNIASIYGFEADAGIEALVLELVEGPTLADRLTHGPLAIDESLAIARQIADALGAAHEAGVVHRDLKPANVKVRDDGTVKVLDFGLAKIADTGRTTAHPPMESPTITTPAMTAAGIILGTAAYMAPEQAKGKTADRRSDIWAFGCVLYEMLTGRRAFEGDDVSDTMAAILRSEPDWTVVDRKSPPAIGRVLRRCLEKEPARRYHAIADAQLDLAEKTEVASPAAVAPRGPARERVAWTLVATLVAGGLVYVARRDPPQIAPTVRFQISPPEKGFFGSVGGVAGGMSGATMSPDGTRLAFVATDQDGKSTLWVRALEASAARALPETLNASMPFWSPNGRSIGFFAMGKMKSVDLSSGSVRVIADAMPGRGGSWGNREVIVFSRGNPSELVRVSADGGVVTTIPTGTEGGGVIRQPLWPHFLPDGRHFIYWSRLQVNGRAGIALGSIEPGFTPRPLVESNTAGAVLLPGVLLFARGENLLQQRLDLDSLQVSGDATPVNEAVLVNQGAGIADFAVSAAGALVYQAGTNFLNQFAWVDRRDGSSKRSARAAGTAHQRCHRMASGSLMRIEAKGIFGFSTWIVTRHPGSRRAQVRKNVPCGFPTGQSSRTGRTAAASSRRMPVERAASGVCSVRSSTGHHR